MPLVIATEGALRLLRVLADAWSVEYRLFQNDTVPSLESTVPSFVEATFSGYVGGQTPASWTNPVVQTNHAVSQGDGVSWTHDGGVMNNLIYGYFVLDTGTGDLLFAERDSSAPTLLEPGSPPYAIIPKFSFLSEFL